MKTTLYDKNGNMIVAIESSNPVKSSEDAFDLASKFAICGFVVTCLSMIGVVSVALVHELRQKKYTKLSEFLNDPDLHKLLSEIKSKMSKKGLTPIPISELTALNDEEIKHQVKFISRHTVQNAKDKIIGYHCGDIIPGFGSILYAEHLTVNNTSEDYIRCTLYGIFKDDNGKLSAKSMVQFKLKYTNESFDVPFDNNI